jgi:transposase-like protein
MSTKKTQKKYKKTVKDSPDKKIPVSVEKSPQSSSEATDKTLTEKSPQSSSKVANESPTRDSKEKTAEDVKQKNEKDPPEKIPMSVEKQEEEKQNFLEIFCPYCQEKDFSKRGVRKTKTGKTQLYKCKACGKTFTPGSVKGKHYPIEAIIDAMSLYYLGNSLEHSAKVASEIYSKNKIAEEKDENIAKKDDTKEEVEGAEGTEGTKGAAVKDRKNFGSGTSPCRSSKTEVEEGTEPSRCRSCKTEIEQGAEGTKGTKDAEEHTAKSKDDVEEGAEDAEGAEGVKDAEGAEGHTAKSKDDVEEGAEDAEGAEGHTAKSSGNIGSGTLTNWLKQYKSLCPFHRMREYAMKMYNPKDMISSVALAHRQFYRFRHHRAKTELILREDFKHNKFWALKQFLDLVPAECPHQYFQEGSRASRPPITYSKEEMIVRGKHNYANKLAKFVLESVSKARDRHDALQRFMLANDTVTVATEVPIYIRREDLAHMQTQLGFKMYKKQTKEEKLADKEFELFEAKDLPRLITGHIDFIQIRNGFIHIMDYKPNAAKEKPIEQLTTYALALSRLTGLRVFNFKCAWFDEKEYFEFFPLHVVYKPKKKYQKRKITTVEGSYKRNENPKRMEKIRSN